VCYSVLMIFSGKKNIFVILLIVILYSIFPLSLSGAHIESLDVQGGLLWIGNAVENQQPNPLIPFPGFALPIRISKHFLIEPSLEFYKYFYEITTGDKAIPTQIETQNNRQIWGLLVSPRFVFDFPISPRNSLGFFISPVFLFRIPGIAVDQATAPDSSVFTSYFYGAGRFFYPETSLRFTWRASDGVVLKINIRALYPIFHIWDEEDLPFYDQMLLSVGISFSFLNIKLKE